MKRGDKNTEKVPLGVKLGFGLLNAVGTVSSKLGKKKDKKKATVITFGSGGLRMTRDEYTRTRTFTFRIMNAGDAGVRGTAVTGTAALGEVHVGDTVTCVTADGRRFPCVIREIEQLFANPPGADTARASENVQSPPFYVLYVSGHGAEEFHPHDQFIMEMSEHDDQRI